MNNEPIFIVGVPRSGTTLLAAMLAAHSRISCGPETHFFRKLANIDASQLLLRENWPNAATDFICSIDHASFSDTQRVPLIQKYQIDQEQISNYLVQKEPSIPNILSSVTEQYMFAMGKVRWAEKTPDHIRNLVLIRELFPASPIIRIIRDPRDVAISLNKVPWGAMSFFEALLLWKQLDEVGERFFSTDRLSICLKYEDLITWPEVELEKICQFLGESYESGMLDTSSTGAQLNSRNVPWKDKVSQPIDPSNQLIWKKQLPPEDNCLAEAILGDRLEALGYPIEGNYRQLGEIFPSLSLGTKYAGALKSLASSGIRYWKYSEDERVQVKIYLGDPVNERWLLGNKLGHIQDMISISLGILTARVTRQSVYWIVGNDADAWSGYSAFFLKRLLSPCIYPVGEVQN